MRTTIWWGFLGIVFFLSGCGQEVSNFEQIGSESAKVADVGETCGGKAGFKCLAGLECAFDVTSPDLSGVCRETVVEPELECAQNKSPVCGRKGRQKNGYLNECEARRHGAEILEKGLCAPDETMKKKCDAEVQALGNCAVLFTGFEAKNGTCREFKITGCDAEIPFDSLSECQQTCE